MVKSINFFKKALPGITTLHAKFNKYMSEWTCFNVNLFCSNANWMFWTFFFLWKSTLHYSWIQLITNISYNLIGTTIFFQVILESKLNIWTISETSIFSNSIFSKGDRGINWWKFHKFIFIWWTAFETSNAN